METNSTAVTVPVTRTIYGAHLSTHKAIGVPYQPDLNTTLNQKYEVHADEPLLKDEWPYIRYVAIGRGGARPAITTDNKLSIEPLKHSPRDAGLFDMVPWVIRTMKDDLSPQERKRYRMRVPFTKDGVPYVAYYLRYIDVSNTKPIMELRHTEDGKTVSDIFTPEVSDLSPIPREISNINVNNPDSDCLISTAALDVHVDANDINELINVFSILDGDPKKAIISEIGLVSGVDRLVAGAVGSTTSNYLEVIGAQVNAYAFQFEVMMANKAYIDFRFDVGSSELMLL